ncbi:Phage regulatory protein Rha [Xenococcus sp. PCC 7305]|uniref:Rha family transcriptional regulator n=1 Tax=Xenococcus sp. PCC 7305 TaxID=102125 RepID=UPI0002ACEAD4|nr:Rha family transcriptional regulator [Xenococcus sp. PCC 7305]ELS01119.1 Phage regulatory protein Rha [Xenococcus sp. PCC 7305]
MEDLIKIEQTLEQTLVVDSRLIAEELGVKHSNWLQNVVIQFQQEIEDDWGVIEFKKRKPSKGSRGGRPERYALLTEEQCNLIATYSKNTPKARVCKRKLVKSFAKAKEVIKQVIPQQSDRIRELELQLAIAKTTKESKELDHTMVTMHGAEVTLALRGKTDQIVETKVPTIQTIDNRTGKSYAGQGLRQIKDYLCSNYGIKVKSGSELARILEKLGHKELVKTMPRIVSAQYIPEEDLHKAIQILLKELQKNRQILLGES